MSDVSELVGRCQEHLTMSKFLRKDHLLDRANEDRALAADALETLAGEVERLTALLNAYRACDSNLEAAYWAAESRLAKMAGENERLRKRLEVTTADAVRAENEIAKLAPVVEAARKLANADAPVERGGWMTELRKALATLEAAHD